MTCGTCEAAVSLVDRADRLLEAERKVRESSIIRIVELQEEVIALRAQADQPGNHSVLRERVVSLESQLVLERDQHSAEMDALQKKLDQALSARPRLRASTRVPAPTIPKVKRLFAIRRGSPGPRPPEFTVELETVLRKVGCDAGVFRRLAKMGALACFYEKETGNYWFKREETEALIRERYQLEVSLA